MFLHFEELHKASVTRGAQHWRTGTLSPYSSFWPFELPCGPSGQRGWGHWCLWPTPFDLQHETVVSDYFSQPFTQRSQHLKHFKAPSPSKMPFISKSQLLSILPLCPHRWCRPGHRAVQGLAVLPLTGEAAVAHDKMWGQGCQISAQVLNSPFDLKGK